MACVKGKGATLGYAVGTGAATTIGSVVSISGPSASVGTVECTDLSSTSRTFVSTIGDAGELTFTVNFDSDEATHTGLFAYVASPSDDLSWVITLSDSGTITADGILTGYSISGAEIDGVMQAEISVKLTGDITIA